ncbi:protein kinase [Nocardia uniformis]|uniref:non-specific serine/threonine protein kinase n=2 Tax=Nocardia uniformis TaxID=53432 RepID=A0A849BSY6_9NOCA|nr:serine/threonine-protein kinase [Nocardia uniformis]NNH69732.1 protein kinase [Nocardia uniformis]
MLSNGDVFAGYVIERQLGRGGMGSVYLAKHPRLPRMTALKLLNREMVFDKEIRARFEREADLVAQLDHHNIVTVYDRGLEDGQMWISMQYVDGVDAAAVDATTLPPERAVQIVAETGDALDYAHRNEVLHRDVKPANILLARATGGKGERVYLTDFGIARLRDDSGHLTQTGTFTATLAYASPEQLTGSALDGHSDQYSLACTLFWLLTGAGPFQATNPAAVIQGHLQNQPPQLSAARPGLPPALDLVIAKAMAKRPEDRFNSCAEFAAAARQALTSPSAPAMPLVNPHTAPPMQFHQRPPTHPPTATAAPMQYPTGTSSRTLTPPPQPIPNYTQPRQTNQYTQQQQSNPGNQYAPAPNPTNQYTRPGPTNQFSQPPGQTFSGQPFAGGSTPPPGPRGPQGMGNPQPGKSNTGLIIGAIVGVVLLVIVAVVAIIAAGDDGKTTQTGAITTTTSAVADKPVDSDAISTEFPRMVPADKSGDVGYNGANCYLADPSSPPDKTDGEPDFKDWAVQWRCFGGGDNNDPFYRVYAYTSAAKVQQVVTALTPETKSTDANGGKSYTNYQFSDGDRPRMITVFTDDADRTQYLMYTDGIVGTLDEVLSWWRSAPLA